MKINLPTKITISRIVLALLLLIGVIVLYYLDSYNILLISSFDLKINDNVSINLINLIIFIIFLVASLTDFLDGYLARKNDEVTTLGKFLDPIADKMLVNGLMVFLTLNFTSLRSSNLTIPLFVTLIMIIRDLIIDGVRLLASQRKVVVSANYLGKLKTVFQMIMISLVLLNGFPFSFFDYNFPPLLHITDIVSYIALFFSVSSLIIYIKDNKGVFKDEEKR